MNHPPRVPAEPARESTQGIAMDWLNYHHLLYFWTVARAGSIAAACQTLHLAQPTISSQLRALEQALGEKLFRRSGRNLVMTDVGRVVFRYADEIFTLGREMVDTVRGRPTSHGLRFIVGVVDVVPKLVAYRLLEPALRLADTVPADAVPAESVHVVCREGKADQLLAELSVHNLDIVLSDSPVPPTINVRAFSHLLGECDVAIFGTRELAKKHRRGFPQSLEGAPMLLPTGNTVLRRSFDQWCDTQQIRPAIRAEIEDSALLKVFGQAGVGLFAAPVVVADEMRRQYAAEKVGLLSGVRERFYAISAERKLKHPAVVAVSQAARRELFETGK